VVSLVGVRLQEDKRRAAEQMWVPGDAKEEARVPASWARQPLLLVLIPGLWNCSTEGRRFEASANGISGNLSGWSPNREVSKMRLPGRLLPGNFHQLCNRLYLCHFHGLLFRELFGTKIYAKKRP
jgi:hypothetical protein